MLAGVLIREASPDDWPVIWPFLHDVVAAGETYTYDRDLTEEQARALWLLTPPGRTVVAVAPVEGQETIVGTAKMNPNQGGGGSHVASASFMVDRRHAGRGVGRALGEHVIDWATGEGYRAMVFNAVVESNVRAVSLWRSLGFEVLATVPEGFCHPMQGYVGLHVMHRWLPAGSPALPPRQ